MPARGARAGSVLGRVLQRLQLRHSRIAFQALRKNMPPTGAVPDGMSGKLGAAPGPRGCG
ncbi:hypothetical protein CSC74_15275 [Pseudoxanthomonas yeongjuensis]|nr:hypothetical protein CSC74_15275 [Pseudoxanthomonas yeongjuensis]